MKLYVAGIATLAVISFSALEIIVVPPLAAAQSASLNSTCSKLMWVGENNVYFLDEQVFVAEADGRDRISLSANRPFRLLADRIYEAQ